MPSKDIFHLFSKLLPLQQEHPKHGLKLVLIPVDNISLVLFDAQGFLLPVQAVEFEGSFYNIF